MILRFNVLCVEQAFGSRVFIAGCADLLKNRVNTNTLRHAKVTKTGGGVTLFFT
jgi:hypothetical protein